jgi:hypothetical protein
MVYSFSLQPKYFQCAYFILPTQDSMRHLSVPEELNASLLEQLIFLLILYHLDMIRTLGETLAMRVVKDAYAALVEKRLARKF